MTRGYLKILNLHVDVKVSNDFFNFELIILFTECTEGNLSVASGAATPSKLAYP